MLSLSQFLRSDAFVATLGRPDESMTASFLLVVAGHGQTLSQLKRLANSTLAVLDTFSLRSSSRLDAYASEIYFHAVQLHFRDASLCCFLVQPTSRRRMTSPPRFFALSSSLRSSFFPCALSALSSSSLPICQPKGPRSSPFLPFPSTAI